MLRKVTQSCRLYQKRIEENISRYASHYVSQAIGTLPFKLGQNVMWNIASERADKKLVEHLADTMLDKEIHEGVLNLKSIG